MSFSKFFGFKIFVINFFFHFSICRSLSVSNPCNFTTTQLRTNQKKPASLLEEDLDKPIDYLSSPAAQWKAQWSAAGGVDDSPWFERWIVLACITVFMVYFCILREENDIDQQLSTPLFDNVPGLEQQTLLATFRYNLDKGLDNKDIEKRMSELGMDVETLKKEYLQK